MEGFPDMMLRNVMVANPQAAKDPGLIELLYQHHPDMLPSYIDDILAGTKTLGGKELMEAQVSKLITHKEIAGREVLWRLGEIEEDLVAQNYAETVLRNPYVLDYAYFLAEFYVERGQITKADSVRAAVSAAVAEMGEHMQERNQNINNWLDWQLSRLESPNDYFDTLSTTDESALTQMITNLDYSGGRARAFLEYNAALHNQFEDFRYGDYIIIPEDAGFQDKSQRSRLQRHGEYVNPAGDFTQIEGPESLKDGKVRLRVYSATGQLVEDKQVQLPYLYETKSLRPGAYILRYEYGGEEMGQAKLVKI